MHPNAQRAGAGTALVKWGTQAADEQGVKVRSSVPTILHELSSGPQYRIPKDVTRL